MLQLRVIGREKGDCALIEGICAQRRAHFIEKSSADHLAEGGGGGYRSSDHC